MLGVAVVYLYASGSRTSEKWDVKICPNKIVEKLNHIYSILKSLSSGQRSNIDETLISVTRLQQLDVHGAWGKIMLLKSQQWHQRIIGLKSSVSCAITRHFRRSCFLLSSKNVVGAQVHPRSPLGCPNAIERMRQHRGMVYQQRDPLNRWIAALRTRGVEIEREWDSFRGRAWAIFSDEWRR